MDYKISYSGHKFVLSTNYFTDICRYFYKNLMEWDSAMNTFLIFTWTTLVSIYILNRFKKKSGLPLPPGPRGIPILGSLHQIDPVSPHKSFMKMADDYAKDGLFGIQLGSVYTVVVTDHLVVKEALSMDAFMGRPPLYLTHGIMEGYGIIAADGKLWKDQRKLTSSWMRILGAARGALSRPRLTFHLEASADILEKKLLQTLENENSLNISGILTEIIGDIINTLVYGVSHKEGDPVFKWLLHIQETAVQYMGVAGVLNFLPYLRFVSPSLRNILNMIISGQRQTHTFVDCYKNVRKNFLNENKGKTYEVNKETLFKEIECKFIEIGKSSSVIHKLIPSSLNLHEGDCLVDFFLEEQEKRKLAGDSEGLKRLSDKQLRYFMCDLFGAGLDTSNNTLGWFFLLMALNQKEQEAVRQELHTICGHSKPTLDQMSSLIYTRAAICETQRIRPVVPLGFPHGTVQDAILAGHHIPKNSMIMPFQWYIHHDPKHWVDPEAFRPTRFISSDGTLLQPAAFIPFQSGKRMCPGDEFARMIIFIYGSRIISRFHIDVVERPKNIEGIFGLTLNPPKYQLTMEPLFEWS
ncbi:cytochrome P450 enzyme phantom [Arctopsyche grandis]|uniref:cytochrome P450 enzyme phantom n=1 Tax=Arctopsyche grandis TaxID=121162 RepID=UPI00406D7E94